MYRRDFESLNERQRAAGAEGIRQSAQRGGGRHPPIGFAHHRDTAAEVLRLRPGLRIDLRHPFRRARPARRARLSGLQGARHGRRRRRAARVLRAHWRHARPPALCDRRRGLQGEPPRLAGAPGLRLARAALRARPQVSGRGAEHRGARHRGASRAHRHADAGGSPEAGVRRRRDGDQRHAAQRKRAAPQGRAHRRHRRRPAGGRCDSRNRFGSNGGTPGGSPSVRVPGAVPGVRLGGRSKTKTRPRIAAAAGSTALRSASRRCCISPAGAR